MPDDNLIPATSPVVFPAPLTGEAGLDYSPTRFAWEIVQRYGLRDYAPPRPGAGERCWLCGGPTDGEGWRHADAIPPTYTNHTLAKCPTSDTVCRACAAMGSKATWDAYAALRPEMGLHTGKPVSWRCYSHLFVPPDHHECPTRKRWREILLDPPAPPFLAVIADSGQKHLIFRARVAWSREVFPVQFEERGLLVRPAEFGACLEAFERLYSLGFSRDSILSGRYHHGQMLKVGLAAWRPAEAAFAPWRRHPHMVALCHFVAQRAEAPAEAEPDEQPEQEATCSTDSTPTVATRQPLLF